jgi:hypothetical protein
MKREKRADTAQEKTGTGEERRGLDWDLSISILEER